MGNLADEFRLSPAQAAQVEAAKLAREVEAASEKKAARKTRSLGYGKKGDRRRLEHVPLNTDQLEALGLKLKCIPLLILAHLEERWWKRFKRNPIKLPAFQVGGILVCGHVKARGLAALEKAGLVQVERRFKKSPYVTLTWRKVTTPE